MELIYSFIVEQDYHPELNPWTFDIHLLVGDIVFVKHLGWPWPARIEDPSNVQEIVTRFQYAVFLYGIHER